MSCFRAKRQSSERSFESRFDFYIARGAIWSSSSWRNLQEIQVLVLEICFDLKFELRWSFNQTHDPGRRRCVLSSPLGYLCRNRGDRIYSLGISSLKLQFLNFGVSVLPNFLACVFNSCSCTLEA